ncbi:hypothetical protein HDV57DRAFT_489924 [Trichoderma longibrachiatum]
MQATREGGTGSNEYKSGSKTWSSARTRTPNQAKPTDRLHQLDKRAKGRARKKCLAIPSVRSSILAACIHFVSLLAPTLDRRAIRPFAAAFPLHSPVSFLRIVSFPSTWQRCLAPTGVWEESHNLICLGGKDIAGSVRGRLCLQSPRDFVFR